MLHSPQSPVLGVEDAQNPTSYNNTPTHNTTSSNNKVAFSSTEFPTPDKLSRGTNSMSGQEEEAVVYNSSRMLQDPRGRLCNSPNLSYFQYMTNILQVYLGDAATLSFLQLVRMIVEWNSGPTPFTSDPRRHRITENTSSLPKNTRAIQLLPPKETSLVLLHAFFDHTCGIVDVFDRSTFINDVENCYSDPLSVDPRWLCLLHLVFANGLVMAAPQSGTREDAIIQKLRSESLDRAELFYLSAKDLGDLSNFENPDLCSIQELLLTTLYMLAISKRNSAYHYFGMATRSAFALGLHREESMVIFSPEQRTLRRNLWRSLFVVDRFRKLLLYSANLVSSLSCHFHCSIDTRETRLITA